MKVAAYTLLTAIIVTTSGCGGEGSSPSSSTSNTQQANNIDGNCSLTTDQAELLEEHNKARALARSCGSDNFSTALPLQWNCTLAQASYNHSTDMAAQNFFSHTGSDGLSPFNRMTNLGYNFSSAGENIFAGPQSATTAVAGWLNSPGHCRNIMDNGYTQMGGARVNSITADFPTYWTVNFGTPL